MSLDGRPVSPDLAARVLRRLGYPEHVDPDLAGLSALYRAWCAHVPFDNTRKMIALAASAARHGQAAVAAVVARAVGAGRACDEGTSFRVRPA